MTSLSHAHVVGVAGVGMSAIAGALLASGWHVTGSDRFLDQSESMDVLNRLRKAGVGLSPQDGSAIRADTKAVVVSTAIEEGNPDLEAAKRLGVEVVHRAEMIARLASGRRCLAITGTAGKTTVTGLTGFLLAEAGLDPTVVNGGAVVNWVGEDRVGNVRAGGRSLWVIEADESDRSLLRFHPELALITNMSKDHFELDEVVRLFRQFAGQVSGAVLGSAGVREVLGDRVTAIDPVIRQSAGGWQVDVGGVWVDVPMPGRHNAENAAMALALARCMGARDESLAAGLRAFRGIQRRLECVGVARGVPVFDDYAHNPAKIAASWRAIAESASRVIAFWRPHGFGPLRLMLHELADAIQRVCRTNDRFYVLPVYYAGGTADKSVTSENLAALLRDRGVPASCVAGFDDLQASILRDAEAGSAVLGMGARDPGLPLFARSLVTALAGG